MSDRAAEDVPDAGKVASLIADIQDVRQSRMLATLRTLDGSKIIQVRCRFEFLVFTIMVLRICDLFRNQ